MADESIRQLDWTAVRYGLRWSKGRYWKRFSITATASGYTVADHERGDLARVSTFAAAKAWAGIRVNEHVVRH